MILLAKISYDVHQRVMNILDANIRITRRVLIAQWLGFSNRGVMLQTLERDTIPDLRRLSATLVVIPRYAATVSQSARPPSDRP